MLKELSDANKFKKYLQSVSSFRKSLLLQNERFFVRKDPNYGDNLYKPSWQIGIGDKDMGLIDIHIAKVWNKKDADVIANALNSLEDEDYKKEMKG